MQINLDCKAWLCLIICPLFTACQDLWTISNEERHGKDDKTKKSLHDAAQVKQDLRALYAMQDKVLLATNHNLFRDLVEDHLTDEM
jgi:hypothetical protein